MKPAEHFKSYCRFWKPSMARRITFYFFIFGLVIFFITTMLYMEGWFKTGDLGNIDEEGIRLC